MMKDKADTNEATIMLNDLAQDIIDLMLQEHRHIDHELDDVSKLIADASKSLLRNFDQINTINSELDSGAPSTDGDGPHHEAIRRSRQEIVTAMQFEDIVQQLTRHAQRRTKHILVLFEKLSQSIQDMKETGFEYTDDLSSTIMELKQDTERLRNDLEKESPVKKNSLSTGKTELF